ncbi:MAG: HNH endonuclease [Actinomycetota bacterium]|nr:HNH endonuclease [Actinomycetota bacterium]
MRLCLKCSGPVARNQRCPRCGTTKARGYSDPAYQRARARVLADNPTCVYCGRPADTADHVIALAEGGTHDQLVSCCRSCNGRKADR